MERERRKLDHINNALTLNDGPRKTGFENIHFFHNCLPELNLSDIDLSTRIANISLPFPLMVNAITGGTKSVTEINRKLSQLAFKIGMPMAVGSQYGAIVKKQNFESFQVVREVNPNGVIIANISALASVDDAKLAVKMIDANALQIHLNVAQELVMAEGDRDFRNYLSNMCNILDAIEVPVIVKETGNGMGSEQIDLFQSYGFNCFDISGVGGTNFPAIENLRLTEQHSFLEDWGLSTTQSLLEASNVLEQNSTLVASGGIRTSLDVAKSIALGADIVAMAGNLLEIVTKEDITVAEKYMLRILDELRKIFLLLGAANIKAMRTKRLYFTNDMYDFLACSNYDIKKITNKRR